MRAQLIVMGIDRGEIEIGDDSLVGQLLRGQMGGAMAEAQEMQHEIRELAADCEMSISEEEPCDE